MALGAGKAAQRVPVHSLADSIGGEGLLAAWFPRMRQPRAAVQLDGPQNTLEYVFDVSSGVFLAQTFPFHSATTETL